MKMMLSDPGFSVFFFSFFIFLLIETFIQLIYSNVPFSAKDLVFFESAR